MKKPNNLLKGKHVDVINTNINTLKNAGYSHASATRCAMCHANKNHLGAAKKIAAKVIQKAPFGVKIKDSESFNA